MTLKFIVAGALAAAASLTAVGAASAASDNANQRACFGQDRAEWIAANSGREAGAIISARARAGENAQINADYKAACQAA